MASIGMIGDTRLRQAFWDRVDPNPTDEGCWRWTGYINRDGYGWTSFASEETRSAYRLAYLKLIGPIPAGLVLDHLCRNRWCVNPSHLEPVTSGENSKRGMLRDVCLRGLHEMTPENSRPRNGGRNRICRLCNNKYHRERYRALSKQRKEVV